ncbi:hypothetical protein PFICI_06271 [Pestalotiopsis fici W106-1]|uniref:Uncharacterized protein n=1 Tax=Pestalotiopsis fici (strain W106-1 / CGMCC3.15140) TaxID=1229662 RepID=W3X5J3_PESFW|nr:uncharacterized protein PFICI_06271 [Pestalotiopsis fici W106-1]ETS81269.1 hypothetical protein PFICI_06271 [Pestalotiopsis fici W106-1]
MPVWSEPGRYHVNLAPGRHQIQQTLTFGNILRQYAAAQSAAETLSVLSRDALNAIQACYNVGAAGPGAPPLVGSALDGPELVKMLIYLNYLALDTVRGAILLLIAGGAPPAVVVAYGALVANMQNITFATLVATSHLQGMTVANVLLDPNYNNYLNNLDNTNAPGVPTPPQSGLGTVELLCRIVARNPNCNNMAAFTALAQAMNLANLPRPAGPAINGWWDCYNKGIAKTVFVCTGSNGGAVGQVPTIVITTSQDEWGSFSSLQNWARACRQPLRRLNWNGVGGMRDPMGLTAESLQVRLDYQNAIAALPVPTNFAARTNARQGVINLRGAFRVFHNANHPHELAVPLTCPGFQPRARCMRCQAFFHYNIQAPGALAGETVLKGANYLKCHLMRACAECIAHYACCHALANAGIVVGGNASH